MKEESEFYVLGSKGDLYYVNLLMPFCGCKCHYYNRLKAFKRGIYPEDCKHIKRVKEVYLGEKNKNCTQHTEVIMPYGD